MISISNYPCSAFEGHYWYFLSLRYPIQVWWKMFRPRYCTKLKVLPMYIPFGTLHKLRQLHKKSKVWMTKVVLRYVRSNFCLLFKYLPKYRTRAIISRGLYIFYPIFEFHIFVFKEVFSENSVLLYDHYSRAFCDQKTWIFG